MNTVEIMIFQKHIHAYFSFFIISMHKPCFFHKFNQEWMLKSKKLRCTYQNAYGKPQIHTHYEKNPFKRVRSCLLNNRYKLHIPLSFWPGIVDYSLDHAY